MSKEPDPDALFPPDKFVKIPGVWVFVEHESDGSGNKPKKVTKKDLEETAKVNNEIFSERGVPCALSIGHTKDEVEREEDQPEIVGWGVKYRVAPFLNTGRYGLQQDWYVQKDREDVIAAFPHRSPEWYYRTKEMPSVALLRSHPHNLLPILRYDKSSHEEPYRPLITNPSLSPVEMSAMDKTPLLDPTAQAQVGEMAPIKELESKVAALAEQVTTMLPVFLHLKEMLDQPEEGDDDKDEDDADDLMGPDKKDKKPEPKKEKEKDKEDVKDDKKDEEPVKFNAAAAGPTNSFVPTYDKKEPVKMNRDNDDVLKYKRELESVKKQNAEFALKFARMTAEKKVSELEDEKGPFRIDFGSPEARAEEVELFAKLAAVDESTLDAHVGRVVKYYRQKPEPKPDSAGVFDVARYARTDSEQTGFRSAEDVAAYTAAFAATGVKPEEWLKQRGAK